MKNFGELFQGYLKDEELLSQLGPGVVQAMRIDSKNRRMELDVAFDKIVKRRVLFDVERKLQKSELNLSFVTIQPHFPEESFSEDYYPELVEELRRRIASLNGTVKDSTARVEGERLTVTLAHGGAEILKSKRFDKELSRLIRSSANGRVVSEGIRTVILGKPNAGKSSLMNVLVGEDRAIVTDIAGTTRDILEEHIYLQGISLNVVDTAGIRSTSDVVEKIGVERAMEAARDADLIIYVVDGSRELDENDLQIMELIRERKAVVLLNKSDLEPVVSLEEIAEKSGHRVISISAKEETGIDQLEEEIKSLFYEGEIDFNDQILITNVRHAEALREAYDSIRMVENSIESGMPEDFFSIDLMNAYEKLGLIVGEAVEDDLVNEIFSKFCMGK